MSQDYTEPELQEAWDYLVHQLLSELQEEQDDWRSITSSQFSKLPCIADRYLLDEYGTNIQFPRYWYKYGEVGNREPLDTTLYIKEEAEEWGGIEIRPAQVDKEFEIDEELKERIDVAVEFVVDNFANVNIEKVKELQYNHFAPNKFVKTFEELRTRIYKLADEHDIGNENSEEEAKKVESLLKELREEYPEEKYQEMYSDFETWVDLMEDAIDEREFGLAEARLEDFWEVFSKVHLRMEHNNNPIDSQMSRWEIENDDEISSYRESLTSD